MHPSPSHSHLRSPSLSSSSLGSGWSRAFGPWPHPQGCCRRAAFGGLTSPWPAPPFLISGHPKVPCKRRNCMLSVGKSRVVIPLRRLFQQTASLIATPSTPPASLSQPVSYDTPYLRVSRRCYHEASSSLHATSPDRPVCPPNHAHCLGGPRTLDKFHSCRAGWHTPTMHRWWAPAVLQEHSMVRVALGIISITSATITTWGSAPIQLVLKDRGKTSFKHIRIKIAVHLLIFFTQDLLCRKFLIPAMGLDQCLRPHRISHHDTIPTSQYPQVYLIRTLFMIPESHKLLRIGQVVACR